MTKKTFLKASVLSLVLLLSTGGSAFAQTATTASMTIAPYRCYPVSFNLRAGATDASTKGAVTELQEYLVSEGYFNSAYLGSGHFGPMTRSAVVRFQASHNLPATGYVGPMTRGVISKRCGVVVPPKQVLSLSYLTPRAGQVGTTVTISGSGFTGSNSILMDGSVIARDVQVEPAMMRPCYVNSYCDTEAKISFIIPEYISPNCSPNMVCAMYMRQVTAGTYAISVQNENGISNALRFEVTSNGGSGSGVSVTGIDAPTTLTIGNSGTWTVKATALANAGTLHYSVRWGDESVFAEASSVMAPRPTNIQTSASFTHSYSRTGVYTPTFTVTDDFGNTASASATVTVQPIY